MWERHVLSFFTAWALMQRICECLLMLAGSKYSGSFRESVFVHPSFFLYSHDNAGSYFRIVGGFRQFEYSGIWGPPIAENPRYIGMDICFHGCTTQAKSSTWAIMFSVIGMQCSIRFPIEPFGPEYDPPTRFFNCCVYEFMV